VTVYSRRGAWLLGGVTLASLVAAAVLLMSPGSARGLPFEPHGYNRSAIGHSGLLRWLESRGERVVQRRSMRSSGDCGLLVFAEPSTDADEPGEHIAEWIDAAAETLLVLPKRRGWPDEDDPEWVRTISTIDRRAVRTVFEPFAAAVGEDVPEVVRVDRVSNWRAVDGLSAPDLTAPAQLLRPSPNLEPLIECDQGVLLGSLGGMFVLADPDLVQNHGLLRGNNADLVLAVLAHVRGDGPIVFDETLHGDGARDGIWKRAGEFPHVLVPVHLLLLTALLAWIANGRHGPALETASATGASKEFLIANIAALLRRGGHHGHAVRRYARLRVRRVADALQMPRSLPYDRARDLVLGKMDAAVRERFEAAVRESAGQVSAVRATVLANDIRTSTEEVLHAGR